MNFLDEAKKLIEEGVAASKDGKKEVAKYLFEKAKKVVDDEEEKARRRSIFSQRWVKRD